MKYGFFIAILIAGISICYGQSISSTPVALDDSKNSVNNPVELGHVKWNRDLSEAKSASAASGKPIFLLFQEVPG